MKNKFTSSTVFRKFIMGLTGLLLVGFIVSHLSANLLLLLPEGTLFNAYAHQLASLGPLLYVAELGLLAFFVFHAVTGIRLALLKKKATPTKYAVNATKGGASKWGFAANNMAITGSIILVFLVLHIVHFKYGRGIAEGYVTEVGGVEARDLHRMVVEEFKKPWIVGLYTLVMAMLGFHLRHGIWSALQSLGLTRENNTKKLYCIGGLIGILLGVGFLAIPVYIYLFG